MDELSALLTSCLVEVWQGDVFRGTGFFVSDQQILTCAHVVDPTLGPVRVRWKGAFYAATVLTRIPPEGQGPRFYELPDVALLTPQDALGHPSVLLGHSVQGTLRSMGYVLGSVLPRPGVNPEAPGLHSVLVDLIGPSGGSMKVAGDRLPRGMSGSPVVDVGSRRVIGLLKAAMTRGHEHGGWMVSLASLSEHLPSLVDDNTASHMRRPSPWLQLATRRDHWQQLLFAGQTSLPTSTPDPGTVPPSWYLVPGHAVVPHLATEEFREIDAWCRKNEPNQGVVRLVHAPGGVGKTRLAQEIARALHHDGWVAGIHRNNRELRRAIADSRAALNDGNRLFIAVDYAETLVKGLVRLLDEVGSSPIRGLRILLLARSAGPWWTTFLQNPHTDLLVDRTPIPLAARPSNPAAEYDRARRAFTRAIIGSEEETTETSPPIVGRELRSTLEIHAAALNAVIGQGSSADANPLEGVLHHERRYWDRASRAHARHRFPVGDPLADRLLALPTLHPAPTLSDASSAVTQLTDNYGGVTRPDLMARALVGVYPNDGGGWEPLRPDRLAETLVADVLLAYADHEMARDLKAIWRGLSDEELETGLIVIVRLAENTSPNLGREETPVHRVARSVLDICLRELTGTAPAALMRAAAGLAAPDSVLDQLMRCVGAYDLDAINRAREALPVNLEMSAPFVRLATALLQRRLDLLSVGASLFDPDFVVERAETLVDLAGGLHHTRRDEEARRYAAEAIHLIETVSPPPGDRTRFRMLQASAHNALGNQLAGLGRYSEAVSHFRRSTLVYQRLVETGSADARVGLGMALTNLSTFLAETDQRELALPVAEQAVAVRRELAREDYERFAPALARSLNALAQRLKILERVSDAVAATTEAYNLMADLAERSFSTRCADLAATCWHHSTALAEAGRLDEARERAEQCVQLRRLLYSHNPQKYEFDLALSVLQLSRMRGAGEDSAGTLRLLAEAYQRLAGLARTAPDAYMSDYAAVAAECATVLAKNGDVDNAIAISREAVAITGKLTQGGSPAAALRYAVALDSYAQALFAAGPGRRSESRRASDEAASVTERFKEAFLRDHPSELLALLKARRQRLFEIADYPAAVQAGEQLLDVLEQIAADDRIGSSRRVADALVEQALAVRAVGDVHQSAELCLRAAASIDLQATPQFATGKAHALTNAALSFVTLREPEKALECAEQAIEILRGFARTDHPMELAELAYALNGLGVALTEVGDSRRALATSEEAVAIYRGLPLTGADHQLSLALALSNLGADLQTAREFERAVMVTSEAITILEGMWDAQPFRILPELARTLANLEYQLFSLGRTVDAVKAANRRLSYERILRSADDPASDL